MRESPKSSKKEEKGKLGKMRAAAVGLGLGYAAIAGIGLKVSNTRLSREETSQSETFDSDRAALNKMIEDMQHAPIDGFDERFFSQEELKCLTENVYHEARGEPIGGRYAVIFATLERVLNKKSKEFPKTICGVVHQPWQFSWTKDEKILAAPINPREYLKIAGEVYGLVKNRTVEEASVEAGLLAGLPRGSIYYKDARFTGSERVQKFFAMLHRVGQIGTHEFFIVPDHMLVQSNATDREHKAARNVVPLPPERPAALKAEDERIKKIRKTS